MNLKQSIFLALEIREKFLKDIEPEARPNKMGRKHAAHLIDAIIAGPEDQLKLDAVQRDLGWVLSLLVERRDATGADADKLLADAEAFDMKVTGTLNFANAQPQAAPV
jgi:hypothetical protein